MTNHLESIGGKAGALMAIIVVFVAIFNGYLFLHADYALASDVSALEMRQVRGDLYDADEKIDELQDEIISISENEPLTTRDKSKIARLNNRIKKIVKNRDYLERFIHNSEK